MNTIRALTLDVRPRGTNRANVAVPVRTIAIANACVRGVAPIGAVLALRSGGAGVVVTTATTADAAGQFELWAPPGTYVLTVTGHGGAIVALAPGRVVDATALLQSY